MHKAVLYKEHVVSASGTRGCQKEPSSGSFEKRKTGIIELPAAEWCGHHRPNPFNEKTHTWLSCCGMWKHFWEEVLYPLLPTPTCLFQRQGAGLRWTFGLIWQNRAVLNRSVFKQHAMDRTRIMFRISLACCTAANPVLARSHRTEILAHTCPESTLHIISGPSMPRPTGCVDRGQAGAVKYGVFWAI